MANNKCYYSLVYDFWFVSSHTVSPLVYHYIDSMYVYVRTLEHVYPFDKIPVFNPGREKGRKEAPNIYKDSSNYTGTN